MKDDLRAPQSLPRGLLLALEGLAFFANRRPPRLILRPQTDPIPPDWKPWGKTP